MAKYLLLYTGGGMPEGEAEGAAVMQAWMNWFGSLGEAVVDGGNPFGPVARTISSNGSVSEGGAAPTAGGYSVIAADSIDAAVAMAKGCPHLQSGGEVSVYETFEIM